MFVEIPFNKVRLQNSLFDVMSAVCSTRNFPISLPDRANAEYNGTPGLLQHRAFLALPDLGHREHASGSKDCSRVSSRFARTPFHRRSATNGQAVRLAKRDVEGSQVGARLDAPYQAARPIIHAAAASSPRPARRTPMRRYRGAFREPAGSRSRCPCRRRP